MKESSTYQRVLDGSFDAALREAYDAACREAYDAAWREGYEIGWREGIAEGQLTQARRMLLRQGTQRFQAPDASALAALNAIEDLDRLLALGDRVVDPDVRSWEAFLAGA